MRAFISFFDIPSVFTTGLRKFQTFGEYLQGNNLGILGVCSHEALEGFHVHTSTHSTKDLVFIFKHSILVPSPALYSKPMVL